VNLTVTVARRTSLTALRRCGVTVPKDAWDSTHKETKMLLDYAKAQGMGVNVELFLRGAFEKVNGTMAQVVEKREKDAADAADAASTPKVAYFTEPYTVKDGEVTGSQVRALKTSAAATKSNFKTYTVAELAAKIEARKLNLNEPFLVKGGVTGLSELQERWSSDYLIQNLSDHKVRYFTPSDAKAKRSFDTQEEQQKAEQEKYKPHMITFEKYFKNCFNYRAKPDFKKFGGVGTEHCEQFVKVADLDPALASDYKFDSVAKLSWLADMNKGKEAFLKELFPGSDAAGVSQLADAILGAQDPTSSSGCRTHDCQSGVARPQLHSACRCRNGCLAQGRAGRDGRRRRASVCPRPLGLRRANARGGHELF
jgi:hypothetical protein